MARTMLPASIIVPPAPITVHMAELEVMGDCNPAIVAISPSGLLILDHGEEASDVNLDVEQGSAWQV